ncbi:hypothetical protein [Aeromicrobium piscarium]|uniref:DUF3558 domain-containing protein n=1 Tax=Aeromicrobium piscarium TaxID=2590901 RepID=A0A554S8D0_9ACTN|nr:hypothetical protein [Aeromicrobium piscarium]TSD62609.1 hypothetical protein FNM00_11695 [Aeromicrobium piscarium]
MRQHLTARTGRLGATLLLAMALTACGGGGGDGDQDSETAEAPETSEAVSAPQWRDGVREAAADEFDELCAEQFPDDIVEEFARFTGSEFMRAEMIAPVDHQVLACEYQADDLQILEIVVDRDDASTCERLMNEDQDGYSADRDLYTSEQISDGSAFRQVHGCLDGTISISATVSGLDEEPGADLLEDDSFVTALVEDLRDSFAAWQADAEEARTTTVEQR